MANWIALQIDTEPLKEGSFYKTLVDKNGTTVSIQTMTIKKFTFENVRYFEVPEEYDSYSSFHIWGKIKTNGIERFEEITSSLQINKTKRNDKWTLSFESNVPVTGEIIFN